MKGLIFNVNRYAIHDGPGIRVTFFLKGCPLSCWWCHNPEGISGEPEEILLTDRVGEMEFTRKEIAGEYYSIEEIISILDRDRIFIETSNGGVTFSGGEPMMQPDFLAEALKACKDNGYHTAIDTSGHFPPSLLESILPSTDLILFDLKHLDSEKHNKYTGTTNITILNNLLKILEHGIEIMLRIPVIPGINDDPGHLERMKGFISEIRTEKVLQISLLPYHITGSAKYRKLNKPRMMDPFTQPQAERMKELKDYFSETGIKVKIGG